MKRIIQLFANKLGYQISKISKTVESKNDFKKVSYAQSGEDLLVKFIFDTIGIKNPSYLDIGAHHPYYLSNTALFYELGSRGVNIEPDISLFANFTKHRPSDINLNIGISNRSGYQEFYIMNVPTLNTFSKEEAERYSQEGNYLISKTQKVKIDTVQNIIKFYTDNKFPDFLNIDAEGIDELIVDSIDFINNFPIIICIETISFSEKRNGIKNTTLINKIINAGYVNYADTYINSIFVRKENWIN